MNGESLMRKLSLGVLSAALALAPIPGSTTSGVQNVTVTQLSIYMGSTATGAYVKFSPATPGLEGCSYTGGDLAWIDFAAQVVPSGRDVYASVLASHLAGRPIGIGVNGCNASGYPIVYGINVNQ